MPEEGDWVRGGTTLPHALRHNLLHFVLSVEVWVDTVMLSFEVIYLLWFNIVMLIASYLGPVSGLWKTDSQLSVNLPVSNDSKRIKGYLKQKGKKGNLSFSLIYPNYREYTSGGKMSH